VHALDAHGAVVSILIEGTDTNGNELQWVRVLSWVFEAARMDVYEADDVGTALARFEQLSRPSTRLENAATRVVEHFPAYFSARDWDAITDIVAEDFSIDDRRPVVNAGIRYGREAEIEDLQAAADVGFTNVTWVAVAIRGGRLALTRARFSGQDERQDAFHGDVLHVVEIDADEKLAYVVVFDSDDIDAAFEELDARYLAGEASVHSRTWSLIIRNTAAFNRRELPAATSNWVNIDHRRGTAFAPGDVVPYIRTAWDVAPDIRIYIAAVHRLSDVGALVTYAANGTSGEGFDAEWREITLLAFEGDLISRCEIFDEADLDTAVARFDDLNPA
jgi:hypothetical protein